jgi:hypothetical protein
MMVRMAPSSLVILVQGILKTTDSPEIEPIDDEELSDSEAVDLGGVKPNKERQDSMIHT